MSIIIFFLVLFVLILVHEWGHFITAKKTGMRVDEFGIGFPPKAAGFRRKGDETEYTLNWLPIGGFVKIWGENYEDVEDEENAKDKDRGFSAKPKWAQALVLVAGVAMNIIFAWFLFVIMFMAGVTLPVEESKASDEAVLYVAAVQPDSPAAVLPPATTITAIEYNGQFIEGPSASEFSTAVSEAAPNPVLVTYKTKEGTESVELTPQQGLDQDDPERYVVGASLYMLETQQQSFFASLVSASKATWYGLTGIMSGLWHLISQAIVGDADFSQVTGPVGIVGLVGDAASEGFIKLLEFTAIISLNLAVINLLPFPALDGGRLVFVVIEAATRKRIPPEWAGRVNLVGFALLMLLMIVVTYKDIANLL
ncbi:MAG: site-2 protease family protein [Candidatus Kaiserbacteria bacterium]|nr:site-2 protease family protein [Candidatus Kaiserbacteria bacterium]MCB9816133.1 site-2 protease family protein [Candidatus Nomurabacteria bacterium]